MNTVFFGKCQENRPLGRHRRRSDETNIKIYIKEIKCEGVTGFKWFRIRTSVGLL
jgi:hypothetical protein